MVRFDLATTGGRSAFWARMRSERIDSVETERTLDNAVSLAVIILSVVLIAVILLQTKGSSFSGAFGGDTGSINRTRRGVELRLFQFTIGIAVIFVLFTIWSSFVN